MTEWLLILFFAGGAFEVDTYPSKPMCRDAGAPAKAVRMTKVEAMCIPVRAGYMDRYASRFEINLGQPEPTPAP